MDRVLVVLAVVVVASGCMHNSASLNTGTSSSGQGLQIATFDISDKSLTEGQEALITLELKNYHSQKIQIEDISLYNTGVLNTDNKGCNPSSSEIEKARADYIPTIECTWTINVSEDAIQGFESKVIPVKLNLAYNSQLSNSNQPIKIHFKPLEEIDQTNSFQETFSNTEVQMNIEAESPVQFEGTPITITTNNAGNGRVDSNYTFRYFPEDVLSSCPQEEKPLVESEAQFTCEINPQTENSQTRNMVISTSYKYVKAPTLDVEVVNR